MLSSQEPHYITKPLKQIELLARVRSAIKLKSELDRRQARERDLLQFMSTWGDRRTNHWIDEATGLFVGEFTMMFSPSLQRVSIAAPFEAHRDGLGYTAFGARVRLLKLESSRSMLDASRQNYFAIRSLESVVPIWLNTVTSWPDDVSLK
jgi:hypothetical protein